MAETKRIPEGSKPRSERKPPKPTPKQPGPSQAPQTGSQDDDGGKKGLG